LDLKPIPSTATAAEREAVDAVVASSNGAPASLADVRARRHLLLPALHAIQAREGWISPGALGYACDRLGVPPAEGYGVASFYALFALKERPAKVVHVCDDIACKARGADALCAELTATLGEPGAKARGAVGSTWLRSPCLGLCEQAPAAMVASAGEAPFERGFGPARAADVTEALVRGRIADAKHPPIPQLGDLGLRLLRRVGVVDPTSLDEYRSHGGYAALRRALEIGPAAVAREVGDAKLLGRGGAAFPTGRKWEAVARAVAQPHYLVCNADESEPGTFKDRVLMEEDPFALVEAMTIAGFAVGAEKGFIYLRGEYPLALDRLQHAIDSARARGLLGGDILGKGLRFDLEIRRGAGAYICGEETALFNSLEGFRGEPRNKPPFPVEVGLFGKPTCVNNVETLVNVLPILTLGAEAYRKVGTADSAGTRLFCLSGHVAKPGLYELPFGARLGELIALAGGVANGRALRAVLLGGAAGVFVGPKDLDLTLTFEDTRKAGATLGSGVVMVFDDTTDMLPILARIAAFFRDESCGQCVPCRVGTVRQEELLTRLTRKAPLGSIATEKHLLAEIGQAMRDASICGLGQTASSAIESAVKNLGLFGDTTK
jgi:NADH-quinone oxidoreductase subunit F